MGGGTYPPWGLWESVKALEQVISPFLYYLPGADYEPDTVLGPERERQSGET